MIITNNYIIKDKYEYIIFSSVDVALVSPNGITKIHIFEMQFSRNLIQCSVVKVHPPQTIMLFYQQGRIGIIFSISFFFF